MDGGRSLGADLSKAGHSGVMKRTAWTPYGVVIALVLAATPVVASDLSPPLTAPNYDSSLLAKHPVAVDPRWAVHVFAGVSAGRTRLVELVPMPWSGDYGDNYLVAGAVSRRLLRSGNFILDGEVGVGYRFPQVNAPEGWAALFLRYDGFFWNHIVFTTVAISTGLSFVEKVSDVERDAGGDRGNPNGSHLLHYLAPEITFALPDYRQHELVIRYHHRSGVFGTFNGVWGGSNVVTTGYRYRF